MTFGLTKEEIAKVETPERCFMGWGSLTKVARLADHYCMERFDLDGVLPLHFYLERFGSYYLEEGELFVRHLDPAGFGTTQRMVKSSVFSFEPGQLHAFAGKGTLYLFSNDADFGCARFAGPNEWAQEGPLLTKTTFDRREKYWGEIESIVAGEFAGKRIFMTKDGQSSLEFHCQKVESYYVQSGLLKVGLRFGRAENSSVVLESGQSFTIPTGFMHMRIALEETVLLEISTRDSDRDSHLVEDGRTYEHKES